MIISDLEYIVVVVGEKSIKGGYANAYAYSNASANGNNAAIVYSTTKTLTISNSFDLSYYSPGQYYGLPQY
jgi:hypothetical protein